MTIRTFRGRTPADALAQVKRELGSDAVILHTRSGKTSGVLGLGTRSWTEITATPGKRTGAARAARPGAGAGAPATVRERAGGAGGALTHKKVGSAPIAGTGAPAAIAADVDRRDLVELLGAARPTRTRLAPGAPSASRARTAQSGDAPVALAEPPLRGSPPADDDPIHAVARTIAAGAGMCPGPARSIEQEIALIRRMVGQVLQSSRGVATTAAMPDALEECYLSLLEAEVAAEIADDVAGRVRDELTPAELADRAVVRQTVLKRLACLIPVHDEPISTARPADGRPRTIALVGPTGVGKTTTIAKLAATYKLRLRKRVGLVTSDTYRIAAVDQLRTYANIIGLPLEVTLTPTEMQRAVRSLADCDVILIDTAGRSQHDQHRVDELRTFVEAASPHETHLVLASTAGESVLRRTVGVFGAVNPTHVIFTKLDEAVNFGVLVNVIRIVDARLSFVTTGQEVPDQIERGNADRLARLVLDGGRS